MKNSGSGPKVGLRLVQVFQDVENLSLDLKRADACCVATKGAQSVYSLAADMGTGFIELNILINTHLLLAAEHAARADFSSLLQPVKTYQLVDIVGG